MPRQGQPGPGSTLRRAVRQGSTSRTTDYARQVFRRNTTPAGPPADDPALDVPTAEATKGRPTPKRRDAEAQRAARVKPPKDRREASKMQRDRVKDDRSRTRNALLTGDERYLPARDKGAVRKFVRDMIDS